MKNPQPLATVLRDNRVTAVRRRAVAILGRIADHSHAPFQLAVVALLIVRVTGTGPGWITTATNNDFMLYGLLVFFASFLFATVLEWVIWLVNPFTWDGDVAYDIAQDLTDLRADIDNGAHLNHVLDSLRGSELVPELLMTLRALASAYAAEGDMEEEERLLAAATLMGLADACIGYKPPGAETTEVQKKMTLQ
ncbi:hypothetical protein ACFC7A_31605 [Streptomyces niveus]|uniref:hypothetical protein n=1 Tax=Streptomyces niveus TaxID=193462 RepID=UPI0035E21DF1